MNNCYFVEKKGDGDKNIAIQTGKVNETDRTLLKNHCNKNN